MPKQTALGAGREFDMIRSAFSRLGDRIVGAGDDAAIFSIGSEQCVISCDMSVDGTHFRVGWLAPDEIGFRCATASLSDLAAMAAEPLGLVTSVGLPSEYPDEFLGELLVGVGEAASRVDACVYGGDTIRAEKLVVDVTVVGRLNGDPQFRSGAEVGDVLYVSGRLGGPAAAIAAWEAGHEPDESARVRFARPEARVREAQWLRDHGAKATIDLSDGLVADTSHIAAASRVECTIELENVPRHPSCPTVHAAAVGGEEYELLISLPSGSAGTVEDFAQEFDLPLTRVGRVQKGSGVRVEHHGQPVADLAGFSHF